ncbi:hypothetical protein TB1_000770 [Malus domestica]
MGYFCGSIKASAKDDPKYDDWFSEDQRIKSWLLSAMKPEIMKHYIRLSTSKEIMCKEPPLGHQAVYAHVRREADHKETMKMEGQSSKPATMAAKALGPSNCTNLGGSENKSG